MRQTVRILSTGFLNKYNILLYLLTIDLITVEEKKVKSLQNIIAAKTKIKTDIADVKEKLKVAKETIAKFKEEISKAQSGNLTESPSLV